MVKTASNSVNVLLHRLNNTHLFIYCNAQLTRTLNCKTPSLVYCVMYTCSYSYSLVPGISLYGTNVPGNIRSKEIKYWGAKSPWTLGSAVSSPAKLKLSHFRDKFWHMVMAFSVTFVRNCWSNLMHFTENLHLLTLVLAIFLLNTRGKCFFCMLGCMLG